MPSAKQLLDEESLLKLLRSAARLGHDAAKKTPIFAMLPKLPQDFPAVERAASRHKTSYIIDDLHAVWNVSKRSTASFIGYTSPALAAMHGTGTLHVIIPLERSITWVCSGESFYTSFSKLQSELLIPSVSNSQLEEALGFLGEFSTCDELLKLIAAPEIEALPGKKARERLQSLKDFHRLATLTPAVIEMWLRRLVGLELNGFEKYLALHELPLKREVWIEGPAIAIDVFEYDELHKRKLL